VIYQLIFDRNSAVIHQKFISLELYKKFLKFSSRTVHEWNSVDDDVKISTRYIKKEVRYSNAT